MSRATGKRREIIVLVVGAVVSGICGGFVTGGSISPFKGLAFGVGFGIVVGLLFRRIPLAITTMVSGFLIYMYFAPFVASLTHH